MNKKNYKVNEAYTEENGSRSAIFLLNKPIGITSHDLVDKTRRFFKTKKVGHAGTLDPFAEGLVVILLGKTTKLSEQLMGSEKEYVAEILLGISTKSGDIEEKALRDSNKKVFNRDRVSEILESFKGEYLQSVPLFSSVKVNGDKLRDLVRRYESFEIVEKEGKKIARFINDKNVLKEVEIPVKKVEIKDIELLELKDVSVKEIKEKTNLFPKFTSELEDNFEVYQVASVRIECSKGTYIRQLAIDIGEKLDTYACLIGLKRTRIGEFKIEDSIKEFEKVPI